MAEVECVLAAAALALGPPLEEDGSGPGRRRSSLLPTLQVLDSHVADLADEFLPLEPVLPLVSRHQARLLGTTRTPTQLVVVLVPVPVPGGRIWVALSWS